MWCVLLQLLSALHTIHSNNLAARVVDYNHILETTRKRFQIGSVGILDVLEPRNNLQELQMKDLQQLGSVMILLGSRGCAKKDVYSLAVRYSDHFVFIVKTLLQGEMSAESIIAKCSSQLLRTVNTAMATSDCHYAMLV